MTPEHLLRQIELIPLEVLGEKITVIGAGAIGSFTVLQLAKIGFEAITVWDDDVVSVENMNSQFYRFKDIGRPKVEALFDLVKDFTNVEILALPSRYETGTMEGIVINAVDNMATRKLVFDNLALKSPRTKFVIDPRMGAETAVMHVFNPNIEKECEEYKNTLYSDADAVVERCTAKSTMYTVNLLSGLVCKTVKDICLGDPHLKNVSWDIKTFSLSAWNSRGKNPNLSLPSPPEIIATETIAQETFTITNRNLGYIEELQNTLRQTTAREMFGFGDYRGTPGPRPPIEGYNAIDGYYEQGNFFRAPAAGLYQFTFEERTSFSSRLMPPRRRTEHHTLGAGEEYVFGPAQRVVSIERLPEPQMYIDPFSIVDEEGQ